MAVNEWLKLPGLFHRSEFEQVIEVDGEHEYLFEPAGHDDKGCDLVAIYCRPHHRSGGAVLLDIPRLKPPAVRAANEGGVA
jgi:hypothetical protein